MTNIVTVKFHGAEIVGFQNGSAVVFAVKPIATAMAMDWPQFKRIQRDPVLSEGIVMMTIPLGPGGPQTAVCLDLERIHGWLFKIDSSRVRDTAMRETIQTYQRECCQVLERHFSQDRDRAAKDAQASLNLNLQTVRLTAKVFGLRCAQQQWRNLELPWVPEMAAVLRQGDLFSQPGIEWHGAP